VSDVRHQASGEGPGRVEAVQGEGLGPRELSGVVAEPLCGPLDPPGGAVVPIQVLLRLPRAGEEEITEHSLLSPLHLLKGVVLMRPNVSALLVPQVPSSLMRPHNKDVTKGKPVSGPEELAGDRRAVGGVEYTPAVGLVPHQHQPLPPQLLL